jgi:hypothetical protein
LVSSDRISKDSIRELYHESRQRIRMILQMLGKPEPEKSNPHPDDKSFAAISNLINSIMSSGQFEPSNQYRDAIIDVSSWLNSGFEKNYLNQNENKRPHPLYVVKKGVDLLHTLLHRDLRRRIFSSEESTMYQEFLSLSSQLPDPRRQRLDQSNVDNMIDDLMKKSL